MITTTDYFSVDVFVDDAPLERYLRFEARCMSLICAGHIHDVSRDTVFCHRCGYALLWTPIRLDGLPKFYHGDRGVNGRRQRRAEEKRNGQKKKPR